MPFSALIRSAKHWTRNRNRWILRSFQLCSAMIVTFAAGREASAQEAKPVKTVGGHVGIATPLVTISDDTTTIGDQFTLLNPIGIGFKVSERVAIDFETVVATPIDPGGVTGLVVDPGVIYGFDGFAVGLRAAFQINTRANFGLIPLVNAALIDFGGAAWFVEGAFPTFYADEKLAFNVVLHTGVGF